MFYRCSILFAIFFTLGSCTNAVTNAAGKELPAAEYHADVKPLLDKHCVACHTEGGVASFALDSYDSAKEFASVAIAAAKSRTMPPFNVDNSGSCKTYSPARWMTDEEISVLEGWGVNEMAEGEQVATVSPASTVPDVTVQTIIQTPAYLPGPKLDDYRCFIMDPEFDREVYMTAITGNPSAPEVAHHLLLFALDSAETIQKFREADDADEGVGFGCSGNLGNSLLTASGVRLVNVWAPGTSVAQSPPGTGIKMTTDTVFVAQVHHNLINGAQENVMDIGIAYTENVDKEVHLLLLDDFDLEVPAGEEAAEYSWEWSYGIFTGFYGLEAARGLDILGIYPHMHDFGTQQNLTYIDGDGEEHCMYQVNNWDYNWQEFFFYEENERFVMNDGKIRLTCTYDTRTLTEPLEWGEGTQDEMCLTVLYATYAD